MAFWKDWFGSHPLKAASLIVIVAVASVAAAYAYISVRSPQAGPQVSVVSQPLKLTIGLDKTEFTLGENITIYCSVENVGNETITILFFNVYGYVDDQYNYHRVYLDFIIKAANGTEIYRWSHWRGALAVTEDVILDPGEKLENTFLWNQKIDLLERVQAPADTYFIKAVMPPGRSTFQIKPGPNISLETPSITFVIG